MAHFHGLERRDLMKNSYTLRLDTFANFPKKSGISPEAFAREYFFFIDTGVLDGDVCQCSYCGGTVRGWKRGDDPKGIHKMHFPDCARSQERVPVAVSDRMVNRTYMAYETRLGSFHNSSMFQSSADLARSGLFYLGFNNFCQCYCCGQRFMNWAPTDNPFEKHSNESPGCDHIEALRLAGGMPPTVVTDVPMETNDPPPAPLPPPPPFVPRQVPVSSDPSDPTLEGQISNYISLNEVLEGALNTGLVLPYRAINVVIPVDQGWVQRANRGGTVFSNIAPPIMDQLLVEHLNTMLDTIPFNGEGRPILPNPPHRRRRDPLPISDPIPVQPLTEQEMEIAEREFTCKICSLAQITQVYVDCGHMYGCEGCNSRLTEDLCPICRSKIKVFMKMYRNSTKKEEEEKKKE